MRRSNLTIGVYRTWALAATVVAALLAIGLIVALVAELASPEWGWRWGSAGEWVGGIGGLLAFLMALGIAYVERNRHRRTIERQESEDRARQHQRASRIEVALRGPEADPNYQPGPEDVYGDAPEDNWMAIVENRSEAPIFEIVASLSYADQRLEPQTVDLVWCRPGDRATGFVKIHDPWLLSWNLDDRPMRPLISAEWTDVDNVNWQGHANRPVERLEPGADVGTPTDREGDSRGSVGFED